VTLQTLERAELFWVTTVRSDGRPHTTPLVSVWSDGALCFATGVGEQKEVNLRRNRRVILLTGRNDWDDGLDIVVEGEAKRVEDRDRLERAAAVWTAKWDGPHQSPLRLISPTGPVSAIVEFFTARRTYA
jgi:general stress protein 26